MASDLRLKALSRRDYEMGQFRRPGPTWTPIRARCRRYDQRRMRRSLAIQFAPERVLELGMGTGRPPAT